MIRRAERTRTRQIGSSPPRGWKRSHWNGLRHRHDAKAAGNCYSRFLSPARQPPDPAEPTQGPRRKAFAAQCRTEDARVLPSCVKKWDCALRGTKSWTLTPGSSEPGGSEATRRTCGRRSAPVGPRAPTWFRHLRRRGLPNERGHWVSQTTTELNDGARVRFNHIPATPATGRRPWRPQSSESRTVLPRISG
jgi:hypothetical protein